MTQNQLETEITPDHDEEAPVAKVSYEVTCYGVDLDVHGINRRLQDDEIVIPKFQRNYIWTLPQASRFIESLLIGLPVPGIFLTKDLETQDFIVIDGQQRLKTIQFFCAGTFNPPSEKSRPFKLTKVQAQFEGMAYDDLEPSDRKKFNSALIHATVVKQDSPQADDTSVYHIFDRINSEGMRLSNQEMRCALYQGELIDEITAINDEAVWRTIFGNKNKRQRDQELILRFFAFLKTENPYRAPMHEFLTKFLAKYRNPGNIFLKECKRTFLHTMELFEQALGPSAFRPEGAFNAAVFDSMAVGLARRLNGSSDPPTLAMVEDAYHCLLQDSDYMDAVLTGTSHVHSVTVRMDKATRCFASS